MSWIAIGFISTVGVFLLIASVMRSYDGGWKASAGFILSVCVITFSVAAALSKIPNSQDQERHAVKLWEGERLVSQWIAVGRIREMGGEIRFIEERGEEVRIRGVVTIEALPKVVTTP